jgi:hypothetical protein
VQPQIAGLSQVGTRPWAGRRSGGPLVGPLRPGGAVLGDDERWVLLRRCLRDDALSLKAARSRRPRPSLRSRSFPHSRTRRRPSHHHRYRHLPRAPWAAGPPPPTAACHVDNSTRRSQQTTFRSATLHGAISVVCSAPAARCLLPVNTQRNQLISMQVTALFVIYRRQQTPGMEFRFNV